MITQSQSPWWHKSSLHDHHFASAPKSRACKFQLQLPWGWRNVEPCARSHRPGEGREVFTILSPECFVVRGAVSSTQPILFSHPSFPSSASRMGKWNTVLLCALWLSRILPQRSQHSELLSWWCYKRSARERVPANQPSWVCQPSYYLRNFLKAAGLQNFNDLMLHL